MKKRILLVLAVVLAIVLSPMASVFAAPTPDPTVNKAAVDFDVDLTVETAGVFPNYAFDFTVAADSGNPSTAGTVTPGNSLSIGPFTGAGTVATKTGTFGVTFPDTAKVGTYKFTLSQADKSQTGIAYDFSTHRVEIDIVNQTDEGVPTEKTTINAVRVYTTESPTTENPTPSPAKNEDAEIDVEDGIITATISNAYKNTYTSASGIEDLEDPTTAALSLKKIVMGPLADTTQGFNFTIEVSDAIMDAGQVFPVSIKRQDGSVDKTESIVNGGTLNITLKHGEVAGIYGLSVEATYEITEMLATGYNTSYSINEAAGTGLGTGLQTIAEGGVDVVYTNTNPTEPENPDTGVILTALPYVMMVLLVAAISVTFVVRRRRRTEEDC